jgi:RimJ/RimL family protein N-acetyltransferase
MTSDQRTVAKPGDVRTIDQPDRDVGPWRAARFRTTVEAGRSMGGVIMQPSAASVVATVRDGRTVVLRQLTDADAGALIDAVHHADAFDLRRRFMGQPPPDHVLIGLLHDSDGVHDCALGAFDVHGRLVGVAQFDRRDDAPTAEFAIEVATDWQRCGLGVAMLRQLAVLAAAHGITHFTAVYLADNTPIIRLMRSTGCTRWLGTQCGTSAAELDIGELLAVSHRSRDGTFASGRAKVGSRA